MPLHTGKGRSVSTTIADIIDYVEHPQKTDNGKLITGYACDTRTADAEFLLSKQKYFQQTGRQRGVCRRRALRLDGYHSRRGLGQRRPGARRAGARPRRLFPGGAFAFQDQLISLTRQQETKCPGATSSSFCGSWQRSQAYWQRAAKRQPGLGLMGDVIQPVTLQGFRKFETRFGMKRARYVPYEVACYEGWAPAPTNEAQRVIWKEVHALPSSPISIAPEAKKVKE